MIRGDRPYDIRAWGCSHNRELAQPHWARRDFARYRTPAKRAGLGLRRTTTGPNANSAHDQAIAHAPIPSDWPKGTTYSRFLLDQRLKRAHRMLSDPGQAERTISAIAYAAGFGDLSHFNRAFRRRYGESPSDVRWSARRSELA